MLFRREVLTGPSLSSQQFFFWLSVAEPSPHPDGREGTLLPVGQKAETRGKLQSGSWCLGSTSREHRTLTRTTSGAMPRPHRRRPQTPSVRDCFAKSSVSQFGPGQKNDHTSSLLQPHSSYRFSLYRAIRIFLPFDIFSLHDYRHAKPCFLNCMRFLVQPNSIF